MAAEAGTRVESAIAAVLDCADAMEAQAGNLRQVLPTLPMPEELRPAVMEGVAGLRDTSGRVTFDLALLRTELAGGAVKSPAVVKALSRMDAAMLAAVAAVTDVVDRLEGAAEADESHERAFVLVIEAIGVLLQGLENAKAATQALQSQGA